MDESKRREIRQWIVKAGRDLQSARRLFSDTPPLLDTAAYHCQQAAEKALKAFPTMDDTPFQKAMSALGVGPAPGPGPDASPVFGMTPTGSHIPA